MSDLIERLREQAEEDRNYDMEDYAEFLELAADTIEQQQAEIEGLREYNDTLETLNQAAKDANKKWRALWNEMADDATFLKEKNAKLEKVLEAADRVIGSWFDGNVDGDLDGNMHDLAEAHAAAEDE